MKGPPKAQWGRWKSLAYRLLLAALGWWIISEGQSGAWVVGVPALLGAVALSYALLPHSEYTVRPLGLLLFVGYFLLRSLMAGFDVARRIIHPSLRISPVIVRVPLTLADGGPRWLLLDTMSLLPGTMNVETEGDTLILHCLSKDIEVVQEVRETERHIAWMFGLQRISAP